MRIPRTTVASRGTDLATREALAGYHDLRRLGAARERLLDGEQVADHRDVRREVMESRGAEPHAKGGRGQGEQGDRGDGAPRGRPANHPVRERLPQA